MKDEQQKPKSLFKSLIDSIPKVPGSKKEKDEAPQSADFHWFKLVPIPDTKGKDRQTFNIELADWVLQKLEQRPDLAFLELYLTRDAMLRLETEIGIEREPESLIETVNQRLVSNLEDAERTTTKVRFHPKGLGVTEALQHVFNLALITRPIYPPQVYIPADESQIPSDVDQYLVGSCRVDDERGRPLNGIDGTPIRVVAKGASSGLMRLYAHLDFDLLLKAFPDEPFSSFPLGLNLTCLLELAGELRKLSQVDLDLRDTKLLAKISRRDEEMGLTYTLLEGGLQEIDVLEYARESYPVELKGETEVQEYYPVAADLRVPLVGKIGLRVELRFYDTRRQLRTKRYTFLFRFFKYALHFSAGKNWLAATGQFVRGEGETLIMLPPALNDGLMERQSPAFVLSPVADKGVNYFNIRKHPDSILSLKLDGRDIGTESQEIDLASQPVIQGVTPGSQDSRQEEYKFTLRDLAALSGERREVAERRQEKQYRGFVDITSTPPRRISLARSEITLGAGRFLEQSTPVNPKALVIKRKYVSWEFRPRKEEGILFYARSGGKLEQPLQKLEEPHSLGLVGTYFFYLDDFEFMIFLESTPRTEILRSA